MQSLEQLNAQFSIHQVLSFATQGDDLPMAIITHPKASASLSLSGAHLCSWQPQHQEEVLWLSENAIFQTGTAIRGGIPICWPWFGAHPEHSKLPAHGFARRSLWTLIDSYSDTEACRLKLELCHKASNPLFPYAVHCQVHIHIGEQLRIELHSHNQDYRPVRISEALHSYFRVGDVQQCSVSGFDACHYLDKPSGFAQKQQQGAIPFDTEVDRIYHSKESSCIHDPVLHRRIIIDKEGSASSIVWNPWQQRAEAMGDLGPQGWKTMLCLESGNVADDSLELAPDEQHCLRVCYRLETEGNN